MNSDSTSSSNTRYTKIYLLFYLAYIILTTFSKFTSYYRYLHPVYVVTVLLSIVFNLIFLFVLNIGKSKIDSIGYVLSFLVIISLIVGFVLKIQIMTIPLAAIYLFLINLRNINFHVFIKNDLKIKCYLLITIVVLYLLHLCPSFAYSIEYRNGIPRLSLGFSVYAMLSDFILFILVSYMILLGKKIYEPRYLIGILALSFITFFLTDTRGPLMAELMIISLVFVGKIHVLKRIVEILSIPFLIFMSVISIIIPLDVPVTSSSYFYWNKLFSNRLELQQAAVKVYPIKSFGYKHIDLKLLTYFNNGEKVYVDNTYVMMLLVCGIIGSIIFEIMFIRSCYLSIRNNNYVLCTMIISLSMLFMTEIYFNDLNMYVPMICAFMLNTKIPKHITQRIQLNY